MGPSRFELESEDPQSPRMPGYPMAPFHTIFSAVPYVLNHSILHSNRQEQDIKEKIAGYAYVLWALYHDMADILIRQNNKPLNNIAL